MVYPRHNRIFVGSFLFRNKAPLPMIVANKVHGAFLPFVLTFLNHSIEEKGLDFIVAISKNIGLDLYALVDYPLDGIFSTVYLRVDVLNIYSFLSFQFFHKVSGLAPNGH